MNSQRKVATLTGVLYLVTFVTSIPALAMKEPFLEGTGSMEMLNGAVVLEIILALACIGTAVAFYPIGRRYSEGLALGFVTSRVLEASTVFTGVIALLSLGTIRTSAELAGSGAEAALGALPIAIWEFSIGIWLIVKGVKHTELDQTSSARRDMIEAA